MPIIPLDLTGQRYGRLVVLHEAEPAISKGHRDRRWMCQCDCGNKKVILQGSLRSGKTVSCYCYHDEVMKAPYDVNSPEHRAWDNMKARCNPSGKRKNEECWRRKGIKVCDEWKNDYLAFLNHIGPRPSPRHSVDRIRNNEDYKPGNVRWSLPEVQANNKENTVMLTHNGKTQPLGVWAKEVGLPRQRLYLRIKIDGWPVSEAIETPLGCKCPVPKLKSQGSPQQTE